MREAPCYAVVYDLSDDKERYRVSRTLEGYGFRVQKSVFECKLSRAGKHSLLDQLGRLAIRSGSVRFYRVYSGSVTVKLGIEQDDPDGAAIYGF